MGSVALQVVVYREQGREQSGADGEVLRLSMDSYTRGGGSLLDVLAGLRASCRRVKGLARRKNMTVPEVLFPRYANEVLVCNARAEYKRRSPVARSGQRLVRREKLGSLGLTAFTLGSGNGTKRGFADRRLDIVCQVGRFS